jgi:DNA-binding MarR family transcriptional regulator
MGAGTLNGVDAGFDLAACKACYCLAARSAARAITRVYEAGLRPHGLRATQFSILAALALKGKTPVSELAELLVLERTTLSRSAALLERSGWLKHGLSADAREHPLELTPAGRGKLEEAFPAWQAAQDLVGHLLAEGSMGNLTIGIAGPASRKSLINLWRASALATSGERSMA